MKTKNCIKSMVFLIAILFSFSVNAYNSLNQLSGSHISSLKKVNVDTPADATVINDNIIFEELENEDGNENFSAEAFLILPFFPLAFNAITSQKSAQFSNAAPAHIEPIFLSIRVLRI